MNTVIVDELISQSQENLWKIITELPHMKAWFFENIPSFQPKKGFTTSFNVVSGERNFLHEWEIVAVEAPHSIRYAWNYPEYFNGDSFVTFTLERITNESTKITVKSEGLENYPKNIPEFTYESCKGGWTYFLSRLKIYSESNPL